MGSVSVVLRREGSFERLYAMKRLRDAYREDESVRSMFLTEARVAGAVRHPNVVSVLDVGQDADGPYLIMEYIEGVSAWDLFKRLRELGQRLPIELTLSVVGDAARGLAAAHDAKSADGSELAIIHRDVSPHNLLLGFDGIVRVADFGVAKVLGHLAQTEPGVLKGKLGYMAPEQLRFEESDPRSDLFGLGVVLFELLSGDKLYGAQGLTTARRILDEPPPDIGEVRSDLPPELVALCFSLLAKDRSLRPSGAREVATRLDRIRADLGEVPAPPLAEFLEAIFQNDRKVRSTQIAHAVAATAEAQSTAPSRSPATGRWRFALIATAALGLTAATGAWFVTSSGSVVPTAQKERRVPEIPPALVAQPTPPTQEPDEANQTAMEEAGRPRPPRMRQTPTAMPSSDPESMATMMLRSDDIWETFEP